LQVHTADSVEKELQNAVHMKSEVDAFGVITIGRGCFERCGSNKKTPPINSPYLF